MALVDAPAFCGLIEYTGFTFTQRKSIGRMTAKLDALLGSSRLARTAIIWMLFQDGFAGTAADFAKNDSRENVLQRRAAKIRHGRFALQAGISYLVQEDSKLSGYLSPSMGIKLFERTSSSVAFSKVPLAGWLQIVAFCGLIESTNFTFA